MFAISVGLSAPRVGWSRTRLFINESSPEHTPFDESTIFRYYSAIRPHVGPTSPSRTIVGSAEITSERQYYIRITRTLARDGSQLFLWSGNCVQFPFKNGMASCFPLPPPATLRRLRRQNRFRLVACDTHVKWTK